MTTDGRTRLVLQIPAGMPGDANKSLTPEWLRYFMDLQRLLPAAPGYAFASLPVAVVGQMAFCSDALKPGEASGHGSGMLVFWDGAHWVSTAGTVAAH